MATQNIIQYLETSQYNALPSGGTVAVGIEAMNRRQIETFVASEAIAVGDALSLDLAQTNNGDKAIFVMKADTGVNAKRCGIGIAIGAAAAAGDTVDVCIGGMAEAKVKAGTAVGDRLSIFNTKTPLKTLSLQWLVLLKQVEKQSCLLSSNSKLDYLSSRRGGCFAHPFFRMVTYGKFKSVETES